MTTERAETAETTETAETAETVETAKTSETVEATGTTPEHAPARPSVVVALGAGATVAGLAGVATPAALALGIAGVLSLAGGLLFRSRAGTTAGLCLQWAATVVAALGGLPAEAVALALVAAVVAWDAAGRGLMLGRQLTTRAATRRIEAGHALATLAVGLGAFGVAYALAAVVDGTGAVVAVLALSLGVALLVVAIEGS